ncbi:tetratricopeptide repeat protein [Soonwooa sp.]|uniref:ATP-binding protein n=1 Tax=Soonwooa sp. TaxID=1938592 RepID=UPI002621F91E|nr:tetratricopeptide repeat protein [Soonwooa sp.]
MLACNQSAKDSATDKKDNPFYDKAWTFFDKGQKDSTFFYLNEAKDLFIKNNDSFGAAKSLVNMAIIQEESSDNFGSMETSLMALTFLKEKDTAHFSFLASNYNSLGVVSNELKDYDNSIRFYEKALSFSKDKEEQLMLRSNLANTYFNQKKYKESNLIYEELLQGISDKDDTYPRVLMNYVRSKYHLDSTFNPRKLFDNGIKICEDRKDDWGLDAGYCYLSDYYLDRNKDSAFYFANLMYAKAKILKSPQDKVDALQKMISAGKIKDSKLYFDEFHHIDDSLHLSTAAARNQFALIRYEGEKNKVENEQLKIENLRKKYQVRKQQYITGGFVLFSVLLLIGFWLFYRRRRQKLALEAENIIKTNRLATSKKVHDVVANGLYRVMSEIENSDTLDKNKLLYTLEEMYEKSRDISYDEQDLVKKDFAEKLSDMIRSFGSESIQFFIVGNSDEVWQGFDENAREQLFLVIQELLVNMRKHSEASRVILKFNNENSSLNISYKDNGVGMDGKTSGNGIKNTVNRIYNLKGKIIFEASIEGGLQVDIDVPHQL